uniref:Transmembrane protein 100 n=1 Tax=Pelusios castaneus TaxID=367368 RepID=A0A8C8SSI8_9SAUR
MALRPDFAKPARSRSPAIFLEASPPSKVVQIQPLPDPRLVSTATGGVEGACHRCLLPFSSLAALIGVVATALAYAQDSHGSVLWVLGLALLGAGVLGLAGSCLVWCCRRHKIRGWRSGSFNLLMGDQLQKKAVV